MVKEAAGLVGQPVPTDMDSRFRMIYHVGAGYAIPNAEDTPYIEELARQEGILLDPVYTGKAWAKFLMLVKEGYFDGQEHIAFVHTGGGPVRHGSWIIGGEQVPLLTTPSPRRAHSLAWDARTLAGCRVSFVRHMS